MARKSPSLACQFEEEEEEKKSLFVVACPMMMIGSVLNYSRIVAIYIQSKSMLTSPSWDFSQNDKEKRLFCLFNSYARELQTIGRSQSTSKMSNSLQTSFTSCILKTSKKRKIGREKKTLQISQISAFCHQTKVFFLFSLSFCRTNRC